MAHGDAQEGKWRGNWRMEWVARTLILPRNVLQPPLLPLVRTIRLPEFDWTDAPTDLNGLVHFGERRNLVSARVPSRFKRAIPKFLRSVTLLPVRSFRVLFSHSCFATCYSVAPLCTLSQLYSTYTCVWQPGNGFIVVVTQRDESFEDIT